MKSEFQDDSMFGVPLLADDRGESILLRFLQSTGFKPDQALNRLVEQLKWRREFKAETIIDEDLGFDEFEGVVSYVNGYDREGRPINYSSFQVFNNREIYDRVLGDDQKIEKFLRWRVQVLEKGLRLLSFKAGTANSICEVVDVQGILLFSWVAIPRIISLFKSHYSEMIARKIFINVPWLVSLLHPLVPGNWRSMKYVVCKEGKVPDTLYRFIKPESIHVHYGGLSRPRVADVPNGPPISSTQFFVKAGERVTIETEGIKDDETITSDIVVGGWDVMFSAEFVPVNQNSYSMFIERPRKIAAITKEPVTTTFTANKSGKLVFTIDNTVSRKSKVAAYQFQVRGPTSL